MWCERQYKFKAYTQHQTNPNTVWYGGLHFLRFPIVTIYQLGGVFLMRIYVIRFTFYVTYVQNRLINRIFNIPNLSIRSICNCEVKRKNRINETKNWLQTIITREKQTKNPIIHWCEHRMWVQWLWMNNEHCIETEFTNIQRYRPSSITIDVQSNTKIWKLNNLNWGENYIHQLLQAENPNKRKWEGKKNDLKSKRKIGYKVFNPVFINRYSCNGVRLIFVDAVGNE